MLKKIIILLAMSLFNFTTAFAGSFYLGPALTYLDVRSSETTFHGILPALYLGYGGWVREWLNLSLEAFGATQSINTNNSDEKSRDFRMKYNYGLSLVPKVNLDDTLYGIGRIGYIRTKFTDLNAIGSGWEAGLGLQGLMVPCLEVRGEVDYVKYGRVNDVGSLHSIGFTAALLYHLDGILG